MARAPQQDAENAREGLMAHLLAGAFTKGAVTQKLIALEEALERRAYESDGATKTVDDAWSPEAERYFAGHERFSERLAELSRDLDALPTFTLYTPRTLSAASIAHIGTWCRTEIDPALVLDVRVDAQAVGGCLFAWKGVLHDFSFDYFLRQRAGVYAQALAGLFARP